jgi:hypothetical protein
MTRRACRQPDVELEAAELVHRIFVRRDEAEPLRSWRIRRKLAGVNIQPRMS